ncbi:endonuclease III [Methanomassiliicoccales archaeon RumEn M1]|nr:endonuclease III [Methanomassiliicoccales archaeon RumEn M1]
MPGSAKGMPITWAADPFKMLISTVLSQRTRDESTHAASGRLFGRYDTPQKLMSAPLEEVEELIRPVNFHKGKARAIIEISRILTERHGGEVPKTVEELDALPLVGRKTATCVLSYAYDLDYICVDTHVHRISNRIGLVRTTTPDRTEEELMDVVPRDLWRSVNELLVRFGQEVCTPLRPKHDICPIREFCDLYLEEQEGKGRA